MMRPPGNRRPPGQPDPGSRGAALIIAVLISMLMMSMLVMSLAYSMGLEAKMTIYYRNRIQARALALAGIEWSKFLLNKQSISPGDEETYGEELRIQLQNLRKGLDLRGLKKHPAAGGTLFEGDFTVDIIQEPSYRNVNTMREEEWEQLLENAGVPEEMQAEIVDCFFDWTDPGDLHRLNGAENDDKFYDDKDYEVKNAPLDTIDELLLIKNFTQEIVFGTEYVLSLGWTPGERSHDYYEGGKSMFDEGDLEDGKRIRGIARWLTTFGDGKINVNSAPVQVLQTIPEFAYSPEIIGDVIQGRYGTDLTPGTEDDGYRSVNEFLGRAGLDSSYASLFTVNDNRFIRIVSTGEVTPANTENAKVKYVIRATMRQEGREIIPISWQEELLP